MSSTSEPTKEAARTAQACVPNYDIDDPNQQAVSRILASFTKDLLGVVSLGKDGVFRSLTAKREVLSAEGLTPKQIEALMERLPRDYRGDFAGVDGTKTPKEKWFRPDEGILPAPLSDELVLKTKNDIEADSERYGKLIEEAEGKLIIS